MCLDLSFFVCPIQRPPDFFSRCLNRWILIKIGSSCQPSRRFWRDFSCSYKISVLGSSRVPKFMLLIARTYRSSSPFGTPRNSSARGLELKGNTMCKPVSWMGWDITYSSYLWKFEKWTRKNTKLRGLTISWRKALSSRSAVSASQFWGPVKWASSGGRRA